jgi:hypothetical protein
MYLIQGQLQLDILQVEEVEDLNNVDLALEEQEELEVEDLEDLQHNHHLIQVVLQEQLILEEVEVLHVIQLQLGEQVIWSCYD